MAAERIIKKYANRRLYDATSSRHVTLDDLRKLIVQGERIKVIDDKSGEDLTRPILLQIIADQEQFGQPMLSTSTLESIIRFYGDSMQGFMARHLEQAVASFAQQQSAMQAQLSRMVAGTPLGTMAEMAQANLAMWQQMQEGLAASLRPRPAAAAPPPAQPEPARPESPQPEPDAARPASPSAGSTRRSRPARRPAS